MHPAAQRLYEEDGKERPRVLKLEGLRWPGTSAEMLCAEINTRLGTDLHVRAGAGAALPAVVYCRLMPPDSKELQDYADRQEAAGDSAGQRHDIFASAILVPTARAEISLRTHELCLQLLYGLRPCGNGAWDLPSAYGAGMFIR